MPLQSYVQEPVQGKQMEALVKQVMLPGMCQYGSTVWYGKVRFGTEVWSFTVFHNIATVYSVKFGMVYGKVQTTLGPQAFLLFWPRNVLTIHFRC